MENRRTISPTVRRIAELMDTKFRLPGTGFRLGLDGLIGLVPGIGDFVGGLIGLVLVVEALRLKASLWVVGRMLVNLWLDSALGSVPVVGDLFDFAFKAHRRNLALLEEHLGSRSPVAAAA